VFEDQKTREVIKELGGVEKVAHATTNVVQPNVTIGKNAGVSMPWDDKPGKFMDNVGKP
jgi:hypothetical protein